MIAVVDESDVARSHDDPADRCARQRGRAPKCQLAGGNRVSVSGVIARQLCFTAVRDSVVQRKGAAHIVESEGGETKADDDDAMSTSTADAFRLPIRRTDARPQTRTNARRSNVKLPR